MIPTKHPAVWMVLLILSLPASARGVVTEFWTVETQAQMMEGEMEGASISSRGRLLLAPDHEVVLDMGDMYVWAVARNGSGDLFAGTGDDGIIYRIPKKGDPEIFFDSLELEILCLAFGKDGSLYAGTSPDGMVLKITPGGKQSTLVDLPEDYVWDLAFDSRGNLFAATGGDGKIYRITPGGDAELFYDSPETHMMCLLYDPKTGLYAGGEGTARIYRIDDSGKAAVLYDAEEAEISALAMDAAGNLFAAAVESPDENAPGNGAAEGSVKKPSIYRIAPDGAVSRYWRVPADFVFDLEVAYDGRLLVATGGKGELFAVGAHEEWWKILGLDEIQILDLFEDGETLYLATGNVGRAYRLGKGYAKDGTFTSKPRQARTVARWGTLRWEASCPSGCSVAFSMRTGNTDTPDETWSDWSGEIREPADLHVPDGRYAEWRLRMSGDGKQSPVVESVTVAYLERNLPPKLTSLVVLPAGETFYEGIPDASPPPVTQVFPNGIRIQYSVSGMSTPPAGEESLGWVRGIRTARWEISDPNDDGLLFEISYRGEDEKNWKILEKDWPDPVYSWESQRMPDGRYRLRVVAVDSPDNAEGSSLTDEMVSDPFEVDNTPPKILDLKARRSEGGIEVTGRAADAVSPLKKGRYSLDADRWHPFLPEDGLFDAKEESIRFRIPESAGVKSEPGERTVLIQVVDAAGNPGVATATVR
jgi:hypothetical protein